MRRAALTGLTAGLFAGLLIACREVAMMEEQRQWLAEPLTYLPWPSLTILLYAALGAATGTAIGLILAAVLRGQPADALRSRGAWLAPLAVGVLILIRGALFAEDPFGAWPELVSLALITTGVLMALHGRIGQVAPSRLASAAVAFLAGELVFFFLADQIWDVETMALVLRYLLLVAAVLPAALAGWTAWRLVVWVTGSVARQAGERAVVAGVTALVALPLVIFGIAGLIQLSASPEDDLAVAAASSSQSDPSRPNVILISVDTLRADFVGYAGGPARTPNIDALAAESYVFENAYSVAPWTRPSFASFFSSRYPSEMGVARVRGVGGEGRAPIPVQWRTEPQMLAEAMSEEGYTTAAVVTNINLTEEANADQGFDYYVHCSSAVRTSEGQQSDPLHSLTHPLLTGRSGPMEDWHELERASVVTSRVQQLVGQVSSRPMMLWVHYQDPHDPYDAPGAPKGETWGAGEFDTYAIVGARAMRSANDRNAWVQAHVHEIQYFDAWLGRFVGWLKDQELWDNSVVVFWSDHGEEFWEHDLWQHGQSLYNELLHVPLFIRSPHTSEGYRITQRVSLLDVMPTVLDQCRLPSPPGIQGHSLRPLMRGRSLDYTAFRVYLEACAYGGIRKGLMTERYKLIYDVYRDDFELFDLRLDPGERHNLHGTPLAPDTTEMERELLAWTEESLAMMDEYVARGGAEDIPPEVRERLQDMGYIQ